MKHLVAPLGFSLIFLFASFAVAADLQADLMANEKAMWTAWGKKDLEPFKKLTSADYVSVVGNRAPIVGQEGYLKYVRSHSCELRNISLQDATMQRLGKDVAV